MIRSTCESTFLWDGESLTVLLAGEIDHHAAASVREEIDGYIYRLRPKVTVLDLSRIDFMDSSGLGLIMGRLSLMREIGGGAAVKNPSEKVLRIVRLAGLDRMIEIIKEEKGYGSHEGK